MKLLRSFPQLSSIDLSETKISDGDLQYLPEQLTGVTLLFTEIGDLGVEHLSRLTQLNTLSLQGASLTDNSIPKLAALEELQFLDLSDTQLGPAGIRALADIPSLETVWLSGFEFTVQHYDALLSLTNVKDLDLSGSNLDDAGLMKLLPLRRIDVLSIESTNVSQSAIDRFDRKRPDCILYVDADKL